MGRCCGGSEVSDSAIRTYSLGQYQECHRKGRLQTREDYTMGDKRLTAKGRRHRTKPGRRLDKGSHIC